MESAEKKGLTGEEIDEKRANQIAKEFIGEDRIQEFNSNGLIENGNIQVYDFNAKIDDNGNNNNLTISIAKKGGHIVNMNYNREVKAEVISQDEANEKGKEFLNSRGISNMKATYYLKEGGIVTINYAYEQNGVTIYPDLIKVKVALDNGEILGVETSGYLNNHTERTFTKAKISIEEAKSKLNKSLEITSEGMAIIPTEWKTEILCYEFKGKIDDTDFLVYTNVETGREENILVIIDFAVAQAVDGLLEYAVETGTPVVLCTTGLSAEQLEKVNQASKKVAILKSANMSLGINTLMKLLRTAADILANRGFDIEIVEKHHNQKLDAPSGTALALADCMNQVLDNEYDYTYDRSTVRQKRKHNEIGISAVRGGTIVGEHDVIFAGTDEVIQISHTAYSKAIFAKGAIDAAKYIAGKEAGMYNMADVIG